MRINHQLGTRALAPLALLLATGWAGGARADIVDVATYDNLYGTIDTSTGIFTQIGTTPANYTTLAFAPGGGLYALADPGPADLYRVNATTGASTDLGHTFGSYASYGIAFTPDGDLYAYDTNNQGTRIYRVDPSNGNPTQQIGYAGFTSYGGIQADSLGHIYLTQGLGQGNGIYQIDPGTGQGTLIGNSDGGLAYAIAFVGGTMYAFTPGGNIDRVDLTNGRSTLVSTYNVGAIGVIGGASVPFATPVPEPGSLTIACLGGFVLLGHAGLRRSRLMDRRGRS